MNPKIISYTLKEGCTFTVAELKTLFFQDGLETATVVKIIDDVSLADLIRMKPEAFVIEYEYEKETAKFPNGAEVLPLKEDALYYFRDKGTGNILPTYWGNSAADSLLLRNQEVFLEKDKCDYSIKLETRHLEIVQKIYQINAENNWVADWCKPVQQKHYCYWSHIGNEACFISSISGQSGGGVYYCEQAQEYLKTLSVADQKAFLLIYT